MRIWNPASGIETHQLIAEASHVTGRCAVRVDGRDLLATGGADRTVRIWDPVTGNEITRIPTYAEANALIAIDTSLLSQGQQSVL